MRVKDAVMYGNEISDVELGCRLARQAQLQDDRKWMKKTDS